MTHKLEDIKRPDSTVDYYCIRCKRRHYRPKDLPEKDIPTEEFKRRIFLRHHSENRRGMKFYTKERLRNMGVQGI